MENVNLIVMTPLKGVMRGKGKLLLTQKFVDGMALYKELWKGPITLLCEPSEIASDNLDNIEVDINRGPFETICQRFSDPGLLRLFRGPSLVLTSEGEQFNFVSAVCRREGIPSVYVTEYTLATRLQIIQSQQLSLARRAVRSIRQINQQFAQRRSIALADGVQCNGTPTYIAYKSIAKFPHLFFDSRLAEGMLPTKEAIDRRYASLARRPLHLVFSGRLNLMKGVDHLPLVADHLRRLGVSFKVSVCGDGEYAAQLKTLIAKLGLQNIFSFQGILDFKSELVPFLTREADLFVCCHKQGDPSCTYLETMACGVPIAGYENEAFAGLVETSCAGWVTPLNRPEALARMIVSLYQNPRELQIGAHKALTFASAHTFEKTFRRRIEHLETIADRHRLRKQ